MSFGVRTVGVRHVMARRILHVAALLLLAACGASTDPAPRSPQARWAEMPQGPVLPAPMLMDWAESTYPGSFSPAGTPTTYTSTYWYRYYGATRNYLGVLGSSVFVLGDFTGNQIRQVGTAEDYECDALPEACWPGAEAVAKVPAGVHVPTSEPFVIQTQEEWQALWNANVPPGGPPPPVIDFTSQALIGGATTVHDHCAELEVKRILRQAGTYRLVWGITFDPWLVCTAEYAPYEGRVALLVPKPVTKLEFVQVPACPWPLAVKGHQATAQAAGAYELTYRPGVDVAAETSRLAAMYNLTVDRFLPGGLALDIPAIALPHLRCEPTIASLSHASADLAATASQRPR